MIEILKKRVERFKYFENPDVYLKKIGEIAERHLGEVELYVFGSFVEGKSVPSSDIDVLVVSKNVNPENRIALMSDVYRELGYEHPFEIHVVDEKGFEWYRRFCKKMRRI